MIGRSILTTSKHENEEVNVDKTRHKKREIQRIYVKTLNRENHEERSFIIILR